VIDAEGIAMAKRMTAGVQLHTETLATGFYDENINFKGGDFLKQRITMQLFRKEQHLPSNVIDRDTMRNWKEAGSMDAFKRAKVIVDGLLASYSRPRFDEAKERELHTFMLDLAQKAGMDALPEHDEISPVGM
jgi:trimethylamine:corrinoid methyltransferase-like protein